MKELSYPGGPQPGAQRPSGAMPSASHQLKEKPTFQPQNEEARRGHRAEMCGGEAYRLAEQSTQMLPWEQGPLPFRKDDREEQQQRSGQRTGAQEVTQETDGQRGGQGQEAASRRAQESSACTRDGLPAALVTRRQTSEHRNRAGGPLQLKPPPGTFTTLGTLGPPPASQRYPPHDDTVGSPDWVRRRTCRPVDTIHSKNARDRLSLQAWLTPGV